MNRPLTKQQQAVYDFIRDKIVTRGYGPTVREIGEHMNIKSPNGVMCHLRALERKGMITRTANKSRAIELAEPISRLVGAKLPLSGKIAGGKCLLAGDGELQDLDLSAVAADERIALRMEDDSLSDAHIRAGDYVLIDKTTQAAPGQLAIVSSHELETCLRFVFPENGHLRLQPANRNLTPRIVERVEIHGVVVGLLRLLGGHG